MPAKLAVRFSFAVAIVVGVTGLCHGNSPHGVRRVDLDSVFANVIPEVFVRTFPEFDARGPDPLVLNNFTKFDQSFRGPKFWGYCNPNLPDACSCDCKEGIDPCVEPGRPPILKESRLSIEIWIPAAIDFERSPYLYVDQVGGRSGSGYVEKVLFAKALAKRGLPAALWTEIDVHPAGAEPVPPIHRQFGYNGTAGFEQAAKRWMMTQDPMNLTNETLRFDDRYHNAQSYMLATTFFQQAVVEHFEYDPAAEAWVNSVRVMYAGGSKSAGGALTAAGVDPRAMGVRISGFNEFDTERRSVPHRYETDWRECPNDCPMDDPCNPHPEVEHRWGRVARWAWENRDFQPSWFNVYRVGRDRSRYRHLMLLEITGTHDWINTLGGHESFYDSVDGMIRGLPDSREDRWNYRVFRRINRDHGSPTYIGESKTGTRIRADQLMVWGALRHLTRDRALPRIDSVDLDTSGDPSVDPWIVRVRVTDTGRWHDPSRHERFKIHVAFSDDRDFRRCSPPIQCRLGDQVPCDENGVCRDPEWDDNREEEDKFIEVDDAEIVADGEFRDLIFTPPAEALAFTEPLVAVIVEARIDGNDARKLRDAFFLTTDVMYSNEGFYSPYECCPR